MTCTAAETGRRCHACGERPSSWAPHYEELGIRRCSSCGSLAFHAEKSFDFARLYSAGYFHGGEYEDYTGHRAVHERNFERKMRLLRRNAPTDLRVLEIGCAYGYFVDHALRSGAAAAHGTDVSSDAIDFARKNVGPHFSLADEPLPPDLRYNCIAAWDVWEHLSEPFDLFASLIERLPAGGTVAVTTVDSSSFVARSRGPKWRQIHPPTHLHYPTFDGLARGMRALGLDVVHHAHFGYHRALETYLAALRLKWLVRPFPRLRLVPVLVDVRDTQIIIARKP
jgi:cyclopropane fatty-acyl-phospholipid synthase-like methyltransferase